MARSVWPDAHALEQEGADAGQPAVELAEDGVGADGARVADVGAEAVGGGGEVEDQRHAVGEGGLGREEPGLGAGADGRLGQAPVAGDPVRTEQGAPAEPGEGLVEDLVDPAGRLGHLQQGAGLALGHADSELRLDVERDVVGQPLHLAELIQIGGRIREGDVARQRNLGQMLVVRLWLAASVRGEHGDAVSPIVSPRSAQSDHEKHDGKRGDRQPVKRAGQGATRVSVKPWMAASGATASAGRS